MDHTNGYERFRDALQQASSAGVNRLLSTRPEEVSSIIQGQKVVNTRVDLTQLSTVGIEDFLLKLVHGFATVETGFACLYDALLYLENPPGDDGDCPPVRHLYSTVEYYLNAVEQLERRLGEYLKTVPRLYRRDGRYQHILEITSTLTGTSTRVFSEVLNRNGGTPTIESRAHDERLEFLLAFSAYPISREEAFRDRCTEQYEKLLVVWKDHMRQANAEIAALLDTCFGSLLEVIFQDDALAFPKRL